MSKPGGNERKTGKPGGRDSRLAQALRENLRRRKAQARGRAVEADSTPKQAPARDDDNKR